MLEGSVCGAFARKGNYTFDGRNKEIISVTFAVGNAPPDLPLSPFAPMGESIAIGVDDIVALYFKCRLKVDLPWRSGL